MLRTVPEIAELVGVADAEKILLVGERHENGKVNTDLEAMFSRLMLSSKETISKMISKLKRRLNQEKKVTSTNAILVLTIVVAVEEFA